MRNKLLFPGNTPQQEGMKTQSTEEEIKKREQKPRKISKRKEEEK